MRSISSVSKIPLGASHHILCGGMHTNELVSSCLFVFNYRSRQFLTTIKAKFSLSLLVTRSAFQFPLSGRFAKYSRIVHSKTIVFLETVGCIKGVLIELAGTGAEP